MSERINVLVLGAGAREHALCWKLKQSRHLGHLYCAPGNPGTAMLAQNVDIAVDDVQKLLTFARERSIGLTVVGPELPLTVGVVDAFSAAGLRIFGPSKTAAMLEGSKKFAKDIMIAAGVPTAQHVVLSSEREAREFLSGRQGPIVLKSDGLAAGKGVVVCQNQAEALAALPFLYSELKAETVVAEDFLSGKEASFIVATNGQHVVPLATSHDYKRIGEGHTGPNTGGMGSVSPTSHLVPGCEAELVEKIIRPVLREMERRGSPFCGFLYAGLMVGETGKTWVLEFNARLGDPETQSIMMRLETDLVEILVSLLDRKLPAVKWKPEAAVCAVLAADGYPVSVKTGDAISGLEFAATVPGVQVFHAGTKQVGEGKIVTSGGRVLSVVGTGATVEQARANVYRACDFIQFRGRQVRRDIGLD
ncbi:MAG: phosphoribosylamine--glycine ligase [Oligoflexia bacterium]|nr:phosphoribosylamine--glycine ligase [Oligoflexia bacterium]